MAAAIDARSGGNPLFVWEFGQLMAESGRLDVAPAAVPGAVAAVIERRLARLPESAVAVLRVAAVAGKLFSVDAVVRIGEFTTHEAVIGLDAAAGLGLVVWTEQSTTVAFSHDVVRDVVLDASDLVSRAELHRRAAVLFEALSSSDPSFLAVLADHLDRAGPAHAEAASREWERAARRAERLLAYDEAAACFVRAARSCVGDSRRHATLVIAQGDCLLLAGDIEAARGRFLEAAAEARAIEDAELMARAVLGVGTGSVAWEVPIRSAEYEALINQALVLLPDDAIGLRSALLSRLSVAAATPETMDVARRRAEEAAELAERLDDPSLAAQALAALNDAIAGPAHTMERRENADTIVELAAAAGDPALELIGYRFRVVADLEAGDLAAVDRDIAAFTRTAAELRQPLVSWYVPLFRAMRAHLSGDLDQAERLQAEVATAAEHTGSNNAALLSATLKLAITAARNQRVDLGLLYGLVEVDPAEWASYASGLATIHWFGGDPEGARELLALHARNHFRRLGDDGEHLTTLVLFTIVAVGLGDEDAMRDLYELLLPYAGLWSVDGIAACSWGPVDLSLARISLALDRSDDARGHLERARAAAERADAGVFLTEISALEAQLDTKATVPDPVHVPPGVSSPNVFRKEGQFWTLTHRGDTVRMRDAKGLGDLGRLLAEPGREVHVLDLAGATSGSDPKASVSTTDLGEVLDARARGEYRRRLGELDDELADAEACADLARAERARAERDFLAAELAGALGLDGRPRRTGDPVERARKAVTGRIRLAIGRIDPEHPALARHLSASIRTGTYCAYEPEIATDWTT